MNLQQLLHEPDIELPKPLSLQGIGKLFDYLAEKIPARINTKTHYTQERDPYLLEEPAIKMKLTDLYIMGSIHDTHTNYTVLFGACDHTQSKKALRINRIGFLPIVNKKDVKQETELRRKIKNHIINYFSIE